MGAEYTTDRTCEVCEKTKHWQKFCLGAEHLRNTCRDCHRAALAEQVYAAPQAHHSSSKNKYTVEDLLQSIDRQIEKARRRTISDA